MPSITQPEFTRLFEYMGGVFSSFKRYFDAANLVGSSSYFLFRQRDEFKFFPDPNAAFKQVKNLLRGIAYDADDDVKKLEITDIGPGTSYDLEIVDSFGGSTLAHVTGGTYGSYVTLVPDVALGPAGKILVTAPTGTPGASQQVEIRVVGSAVRVVSDVTGESEGEQLVESQTLEANQITAANFRTELMTAARALIFDDRFLTKLLQPFMGSSTTTIFEQNMTQNANGDVEANPLGLLPELNTLMRTNSPVQTVQKSTITTGSPVFASDVDTLAFDTFTFSAKQPPNGTLRLRCVSGFTGFSPDPEEFVLEMLDTDDDRTITAPFNLRPFRTFNWPEGGFSITELKRKTEDVESGAAVASPKWTNIRASSTPSARLTITAFISGGSPRFEVREVTTGAFLFSGDNPTSSGAKSFRLFDGSTVEFTWTNPGGSTYTFEIKARPFHVGDVLTVDVTSDLVSRINRELRRHFNFSFDQNSLTPTIENSIVVPDLPFIDIVLGV